MRRQVGPRTSALRAAAAADDIARFVRWLGEDRVLVAGANQPAVAAQSRDRAVVQRSGQLMYELSLTYPSISGRAGMGLVTRFDVTADGLPFIGPHRNFRGTCSRSGMAGTAPPPRGWQPGSCCGNSRGPPRAMISSVSPGT